jgi:energy-coupling factor transport system ATP-binding protein
MNESIIKTDKLTFSYDNKKNILENIGLNISEGEFVAVLGHNGSGKSTFARHLNAILLPSGGKVYIDGIDIENEDKLLEIRQRVGMVFQNPDNQIVASVVEEDVAFALENLGVAPEEIRKRVDEALENVNMLKYKNHAPHQLSGGQKQRVAIAGIIAIRPKCIVLDEPTAMLDPKGRKEVITTIKKLNKDYGITVVLITHFMDEAAKADRIIVMDKGKVVIDDSPKKVFSQVDLLKSLSLDVPQVTEFVYLLKKSGVKLNSEIIEIDECINELLKIL